MAIEAITSPQVGFDCHAVCHGAVFDWAAVLWLHEGSL